MIFSVNSYGVLIYTPHLDTNYIYFVNSTNLDINLTMQSISRPLIFSHALVTTENKTNFSKSFKTQLNPKNIFSLNLDVTTFQNNGTFYSKELFEKEKYVDLNLFFEELNGNTYTDQEIPSNVRITHYDPQLVLEKNKFIVYLDSQEHIELKTIFKNASQENLNIGKNMISYSLVDLEGNILASSLELPMYSLSNLKQSLILDFFNDYAPGSYRFFLEFKNIAGTSFRENITINVEENYLDISLLTSQNDSSLSYFYSNNTDLYGNVIYSGERDFEFKIKTNKEALCYFNTNSVSREYILDSRLFSETQSKLMTSDGDFIHSLSISPFITNSTFTKYFWVGCTDSLGIEKTTLHSSLSSSLLDQGENLLFSYYPEDLNLTLLYPTHSLLTNNGFTTRIISSSKAQCSLIVDGLSEKKTLMMEEEDYLDHQSFLELINGKYVLKYSCIDVLNKETLLSQEIEMNDQLGVGINIEKQYYSGENSFKLSFTTSDIVESCRYTRESLSNDEYDSFALIGSNSNSFNLTLSPLYLGENKLYIYCKAGIMSREETSILYANTGPQLSNFSFSFNGISTNDYVPEEGTIDLLFLVTTVIPVDFYEIALMTSNESETIKIPGSKKTGSYNEELTLKEDLREYSSLSITPINEIGKRGNTLEKSFKFDMNPPEVSIIKNGNSWNIICIDPETTCDDIWYGFSNSLISCTPTYSYNLGDLLDSSGYGAICARATNGVGMISEIVTLATGEIVTTPTTDEDDEGESQSSSSGSKNNPFEDSKSAQENQSIEVPTSDTETPILEEDPEEPPREGNLPIENYEPEEESSTTTIVILSALALILVAAGGGGYYAYKKGYLNKQLQQLGIKVSNQSPPSSISSNYYPETLKDVKTTSSVPSLTGGTQKSKYDEHLAKLNSFLDDTLDKKKSVFDSFKTSQKGRVETYNDTLAKPKGSNLKKESEEFSDFYKASESPKKSLPSGTTLTPTTSEDEADKFEEYYKKKKESKKTTSTIKDSKKKQ